MLKYYFFILFGVISIMSIAAEENLKDLEGLRYKKDSLNGNVIIFPKRQPEILEIYLNSESNESYFQLAKEYHSLEMNSLAEKYFVKYEKNSDDYLSLAKYYKKVGNEEKEVENIYKYIGRTNQQEREKYLAYIKDKNLDIDIQQNQIYTESNLKKIMGIKIDSDFVNFYYANVWTDDEKEKLISFLKRKDIENRPELEKLLLELLTKYNADLYYFERVNNNLDIDGYNRYYKGLETLKQNRIQGNEYEELIYQKYLGRNTEFIDGIEAKLNEAINQKNYEKMYSLYILKSSIKRDIKLIYNLSMMGEKYLARLIEDIVNGADIGENKKEDLLLNLTYTYCNNYPNGKKLEQFALIRIDLTKENIERIKICDEILSKRNSILIFAKKLSILNSMGNYAEVEKQIRAYNENNILIKPILLEMVTSLEKQGKIADAALFIERNGEKNLYFEYCERNKLPISFDLKNEAINYYLNNNMYDKIDKYKNDLSYSQYKRVIASEIKDIKQFAAEKYPFESEWVDGKQLKYFYFSDSFIDFDGKTVENIIAKKEKSDIEKYYLAKYYRHSGEYQKAIDIMRDLITKYRTEEIMVRFYLDVLKRGGTKSEYDSVFTKYGRVLNWEIIPKKTEEF